MCCLYNNDECIPSWYDVVESILQACFYILVQGHTGVYYGGHLIAVWDCGLSILSTNGGRELNCSPRVWECWHHDLLMGTGHQNGGQGFGL